MGPIVRRVSFLIIACVFVLLCVAEETSPGKTYFVYLVCEGADKIAVVRFGPDGAKVDHTLHTGLMPGADISGPHGIVMSPDRQYYYVTIAHGRPYRKSPEVSNKG